MASKVNLKIIQPDTTKLEGEYDHIIVPGEEGDFGVYPNHTPLITKIRPGELSLYTGEQIDRYAVHDGFVTIDADDVTIVCEVIEQEKEIDIKRAEEAKVRAEERMKQTSDAEIDFRRAEFALKRALVRINISNN